MLSRREDHTSGGDPGAQESEKWNLRFWLDQVLSSELPAHTRLLLTRYGVNANDSGHVRPLNSERWREIGASKTTYYKHLKRALASGFIIEDGEFKYDTAQGGRWTGKVYRCVTMLEEANGKKM